MGQSFEATSIKPIKYDWDSKWTVTVDLRGLETFSGIDKYQSNYDIEDKLIEDKVLPKSAIMDSEYCQFFAYFKTKKAAESFCSKLVTYVEKRKALINNL